MREGLVEELRRDLLGPGEPDEILTQDPPITTYPIGVLFPRPTDEAAENELWAATAENDGLDDSPVLRGGRDIEDTTPDSGVSLANDRRPSSMGLTFAVDPAVTSTILVTAEAAAYDPVDAAGRPVAAKRAEARSTSEQSERWRRRPLTLRPVTIDVTRAGMQPAEIVDEGVEIRALVRRPAGPHGTVTVTVTLINTRRIGERELQDAFCLYQPRLTVTAPRGRPRSWSGRPPGGRRTRNWPPAGCSTDMPRPSPWGMDARPSGTGPHLPSERRPSSARPSARCGPSSYRPTRYF